MYMYLEQSELRFRKKSSCLETTPDILGCDVRGTTTLHMPWSHTGVRLAGGVTHTPVRLPPNSDPDSVSHKR